MKAMQIKRQHVDETSRMWNFPERDARVQSGSGAGSILYRKHLKTTSEWPQSGPVIPLSSMKWFFALADSKKGGTAARNISSSLVILRDHGEELFCCQAYLSDSPANCRPGCPASPNERQGIFPIMIKKGRNFI